MDIYTIRLSAQGNLQFEHAEFLQKTNEKKQKQFLSNLTPESRFLIQCLINQDWVSVKKLVDEFKQAGFSELNQLSSIIWLAVRGLLEFALFEQETCLMRLEIMRPPIMLKKIYLDDSREWKLSRFAYIHNVENGLLLETPLGFCKLWLDDARTLPLLSSLCKPHTLKALLKKHSQLSENTLIGIIGLLEAAAAIWPIEAGCIREEKEKALQVWEFHDACFHSRSRIGRHHYPSGGTYRFQGKIPCPPNLKLPMEGKKISLPAIDPTKFLQDPPYQQVVEQRCSSRFSGKGKLTIAHLSEFLYRTIRLRKSSAHRKENHASPYNRLYPSGGALYELEFYLLVDKCQGLDNGLHYYSPDEHALIQLDTKQELEKQLLLDSKMYMVANASPAILIILSARFGRMSWKYEGLSYATILKHVGIVFHSFYLAASTMRLAVCANAEGNSEMFANLINTDFFNESSVGEFALMGLIE